MPDNTLVEICCEIRQELPRSIGITNGTGELTLGDGRESRTFLPRAEIREIRREPKNVAVVTIPEWLAKAKGLA